MRSIINKLRSNLSNLPGWRSNRKIVVFESDDWGSIRMPSLEAFDTLQVKGVNVSKGDSLRYNQNDTLATKADLTALYEVLSTVKDKGHRSAMFTAVSLVANPDFDKIKASDFTEYFYEPFTETLKRYNREDAFALWQEGVRENLFIPQFHGREHLNVQAWMRALKSGDEHTHLAFDQQMWAFSRNGIAYQPAFDLEFPEDLNYQKSVVSDGLQLFEKLHGYKATFFVPPNGPFNGKLEEVCSQSGITIYRLQNFMLNRKGMASLKRNFIGSGREINSISAT